VLHPRSPVARPLKASKDRRTEQLEHERSKRERRLRIAERRKSHRSS
jgi:hypothetical protein